MQGFYLDFYAIKKFNSRYIDFRYKNILKNFRVDLNLEKKLKNSSSFN